MSKKPDLTDLVALRKAKGLNQSAFWSPLGVTQSGGSRYETHRDMPKPVALLLWLRESGRISNDDLADAMKALSKKKK